MDRACFDGPGAPSHVFRPARTRPAGEFDHRLLVVRSHSIVRLDWVQAKGTIPTGGRVPVGTPATFPGAKFILYDPVNETAPMIDFAGAMPTISGSSARVAGLPLLFLGRFTGSGHLAVIGIEVVTEERELKAALTTEGTMALATTATQARHQRQDVPAKARSLSLRGTAPTIRRCLKGGLGGRFEKRSFQRVGRGQQRPQRQAENLKRFHS